VRRLQISNAARRFSMCPLRLFPHFCLPPSPQPEVSRLTKRSSRTGYGAEQRRAAHEPIEVTRPPTMPNKPQPRPMIHPMPSSPYTAKGQHRAPAIDVPARAGTAPSATATQVPQAAATAAGWFAAGSPPPLESRYSLSRFLQDERDFRLPPGMALPLSPSQSQARAKRILDNLGW
jgi:hypothetical protein